MIRILHIDDNRDDLELTRKNLNPLIEDVHIEWTESALEAFELTKKERFDCILCDFQMPELDGLKLLEKLRERGDEIPFIFYTGQGNERLAAEALRTGADDYFTKETGIAHYERLANSIARIIELKRRAIDHKKAVQALRESEERYRGFIERSSEGIWRITVDKPIPLSLPEDEMISSFFKHFYIAECNETLAKMYGYSSSEELLGARLIDLQGGADNEQNIESKRALIRSGFNTKDVETVEVDKQGNRKYFLNNAVGIIEGDYIVGVWGSQRDITQIKNTEAELRKIKKLFEQLFMQNPIAAVYLDLEFRIIDANPSFTSQFGYAKDELLGRNINNVIVPDEKMEEALKLDRHSEKTYFSLETVRKRKNGTSIPVAISGTPVHVDGTTVGYLGLYSDISYRKQAEEALRKSEEYFKELLEVSQDVIYKTNLESGKIEYISPSIEEITGFTPEEIIETGISLIWELIHPEDLETYKPPTQAPIDGTASKDVPTTLDYRIRSKNGDYRWISESRSIIWDDGGKPVAAIGTVRDISEQKNAQEALVESRNKLKQYSMELESANRDLEAFNYSVSHDLQSPLQRVINYIQLTLEELNGQAAGEAGRFLELAEKNCNRMMQLISDLLKLSSLKTAGLQRKEVDLTSLVREIYTTLFESEPKRRSEIVIAKGVTANGDPKLLRLLLEHLLGNAWKFTQRRKETRIEFGSSDINGTRTFFIKDNGIGFDMSQADNLFAPFHRLHNTKDFEGSGIGLAIAHKVVELHSGRIWAEARQNEGATFYFTLSVIA